MSSNVQEPSILGHDVLADYAGLGAARQSSSLRLSARSKFSHQNMGAAFGWPLLCKTRVTSAFGYLFDCGCSALLERTQ